jgi:hypothetical protein
LRWQQGLAGEFSAIVELSSSPSSPSTSRSLRRSGHPLSGGPWGCPRGRPCWPVKPGPWPGHARTTGSARRPEAFTGDRERTGSRGEGVAAHPEDGCRAGRDGGSRRTANRRWRALDTCGETAMGSRDSGRLAPIPLEGRRKNRRSSWSPWPRSGRRQMVAEGDGRGGGLGRMRGGETEGEGKSKLKRERKRNGGRGSLSPRPEGRRRRPSPRRIDGRSTAHAPA